MIAKIKAPIRRARLQVFGTITHVKTDKPVVALTFDDGPHPKFTRELLKILHRHEAKATFFVVGESVKKQGDLLKEIMESGHAIGNHTWDHPSFIEIDRKERWQQVRKCRQVLCGAQPKLFRPPRGHQNKGSRFDLFLLGYKVITWNVSGKDWLPQTAEELSMTLLEQIKPGCIILLHDAIWGNRVVDQHADRSIMLKALEMTLMELNGRYQLVTLPELFTYGSPVYRIWNRGG